MMNEALKSIISIINLCQSHIFFGLVILIMESERIPANEPSINGSLTNETEAVQYDTIRYSCIFPFTGFHIILPQIPRPNLSAHC